MAFDPGQFNFADWGASGYGHLDIEEAKRQGASHYNLWQLHDKAVKDGVPVGRLAKDELLGTRPNAPVDYGKHGYWGFGDKDIDHIMGQGGDVGQLENAMRWARDNNVMIGQNSSNRIRDYKQQEFMTGIEESNRASQQARDDKQDKWMTDMAAEQKAHQDFMAKEQAASAARMARTRSAQSQGVGGNAAFRGSRLNTTTPGGGRGTQRFSRVTQPLFMNPLGGVAGQSSKGAVNL